MAKAGAGARHFYIAVALFVLSAIALIIVFRNRDRERGEAGGSATAVVAGTGDPHFAGPVSFGTIEGRVVDENGAGIEAAIAIASEHMRRLVKSDASGAFSVPNLLPDHYVVAASTNEATAAVKTELRAGATARVDLRLAKVQGGVTLRGSVRNILGGPVPGAEVWLVQEKRIVVALARADGSFDMRAAPGWQVLRARAPGYAEETHSLDVRDDLSLDIVMHPAATIAGTVVFPGGAPARGARVRIETFMDDAVDGVADDAGHFEVGGLAANAYDVIAVHGSLRGVVHGVAIEPAGRRDDVRVELEATSAVAGSVRSRSGGAVAGAKVSVEAPDGTELSTTTKSDGTWAVAGLPLGRVTISACAEGFECTKDDRVVGAEPVRDADLVLDPGASIAARVLGPDGRPVGDARVEVGRAESCMTEGDGTCMMHGITPHKVAVSAKHPLHGYGTTEVEAIVGKTSVELKLERGATIKGTVRFDDGKPAAGAHVEASSVLTRADEEGRYELSNVEPGTARVRARMTFALGHRSLGEMLHPASGEIARIVVKAGEVHDKVDLVILRQTKHITGRVVDANGVPVAHARVGLVRREERKNPALDSVDPELQARFEEMEDENALMFFPFENNAATYAAADGTFRIDGVSSARFIVWADAPNMPRGSLKGVVANDTPIEIKLPPNTTLKGRVVDERGQPAKAFVLSAGTGILDRPQLVRDPDGRFSVSGLVNDVTVSVETTDGKIGGIDKMKLAPGETKEITITVHRHVVVIGRIVSWVDGAPAAGITLLTEGGGIHRYESTGRDGSFRILGVAVGKIDIHTSDEPVGNDDWTREIPEGKPVVDLGALEFMPTTDKHAGHGFYVENVGERIVINTSYRLLDGVDIGPPDEIVAVKGRRIGKLGRSSVDRLLRTLAPGDTIVARTPADRNAHGVRIPKGERTVTLPQQEEEE